MALSLLAQLPVVAQTPFSLQKALQTARVNNPVLKSERYSIDIGHADITTARLRPNPKLNNQTLLLTNNNYYPDNTAWNNARNRQMWWQLTKSFQLPGQRRYKIDVANQNTAFLNKNYMEVERNLFFQVASAWLDVWTIENQVEVIQIAKGNADTLARINELRLKNQVISQTDLIRTQLLAEQYDVQLKTALRNLKNRQTELRFLLGVPDSIGVDRTNEFLFPETVNVDSLLNFALLNRSDIQTAQSAINVSASNIRLQRSLAWPQPELGGIWNPQNTIPYIGFFGTIEIPLFSRNQGEIQKSTILQHRAEQNFLTLQRQIQTEIRTAYNTFLTQRQNIERFSVILNQSQTILNNVRYAYLRGGTTIIDFLEAQRSWLETQQQYFDTQQQYRQSYIQLLFVSGIINQLAQ